MPINLVTGAASLEVDDIVVPGRVALRWIARYTTSGVDRMHTPIGRGWYGIAFCTLQHVDGAYLHVTERGAEERFEDRQGVVAAGGVVRNLGAYLEVFRDGGRYIVRSWDVATEEIRDLCFTPSAERQDE